jgi:vitamin B12 transporter
VFLFLFPPEDVSVFHKTLNTSSVFGQNEVRLFDRLFASGGVRWEDNDTFGEATTPRASLAFLIKEIGAKLRGGWGKGFRAPTINDLLFPGFGNTGLKPEHSESWEVGFDQKLWENRIRFGTTYFHNTFRDLIQFKPVPTAPFGVLPINVGRAKTYGWEHYVEVEPLDWLLFYANYTITRTRDTDAHTDLARTPAHHWNLGITVTPTPRLTLFVQANVVSSALESAAQGTRNPGYHRIDAGATYRLFGKLGHVERTELTARIENLTDEVYTEVFGVRAAGLSALVGLRSYFK